MAPTPSPISARGRSDDGVDTGNHKRRRTQNGSFSPPRASSSFPSKQVSSAQLRVTEDTNGPSKNRDTNNGRTHSTFESLPIEILEKIFLYSLNVNLPRVLPRLAVFFSNERIYRLLILLAFWDNEDDHDKVYNPSKDGHVFGGIPARYGDLGTPTWRENKLYDIFSILRPLGRDYVPLNPDERRSLQSDILRCKWCTNDRIRRQLPDLTRLLISRWCINAGYIHQHDNEYQTLEEVLQSKEERNVTVRVVRVSKECPGQPEKNDRHPRGYLTVRVGEFVQLSLQDIERAPDPDPTVLLHYDAWHPVLGIMAIPPFLLNADVDADHKGLVRGIFTDAHLSFLNTLRLSGQLLFYKSSGNFPEITHSRDAIQQGIRIALLTVNPRALDIMLKLDLFFRRRFNDLYTFPSDHFRIAAQEYLKATDSYRRLNKFFKFPSIKKAQGAALLPFCLLVTSSPESIPHDDPLIRQFALVEGGAFGKWLLDLMAELPRHLKDLHGESDEAGIYWFGAREPVVVTTMGRRYQDEVMPELEFLDLPQRWVFDELEDRDDTFDLELF